MFHTIASEHIDEALAATFPASDPPAWNPGTASLIPRSARKPVAVVEHPPRRATTEARTDGVLDVSRPFPSERTFGQALVSLAGAALIALLVPVAIVLICTPVALLVLGLLEVVPWLLAFVR